MALEFREDNLNSHISMKFNNFANNLQFNQRSSCLNWC